MQENHSFVVSCKLVAVSISVVIGLGAILVVQAYSSSDNREISQTDEQKGKANKDKVQSAIDESAVINLTHQYVGLSNLGNTCYLNSLLQALSGSQHYLKFAQNIIKNKLIKLSDESEDETCNDILYHFIVLLLQLCYHDQDADPAVLHSMICRDTRLFRMNEECDTHELNLYIQDKLITQIPVMSRQNIQQSDALSVFNGSRSADNRGDATEELLMIRPLGSLTEADRQSLQVGQNPMLTQYQMTIECQECVKHQCPPVHRTDSQLDINLDLPITADADVPVMLSALIEESFKSIRIEGYKCIKCSLRRYLMKFANVKSQSELINLDKVKWNLTDGESEQMTSALDYFLKLYRMPELDQDMLVKLVTKFKEETGNTLKHQFDLMEVTIFQYKRIVKPPRLLCLHLNRLTYNNQGNVFMNKLHIKFNEHMDLNSNKVCSFETDMRYRLVSVIEHFGSQNKGHYIAAKMINQPIDKEHQGMFLLCNDSKTFTIPASQVLKSNAFMLFYEKVA